MHLLWMGTNNHTLHHREDALLEILDVASKAHLTEPQLAIALNINVPATPVLDAAAAFASFTFPKSDRAPGSGSFSSPLYDYLVQLVNLLNYLAVILGNHNQSIMLEYTRLLMELGMLVASSGLLSQVLLLASPRLADPERQQ